MQKMYSVAVALMIASTAIGAPVTYEGMLGDGTTPFSEYFTDTKGSASSKTPYVHPTNVINLASKESARLIALQEAEMYTYIHRLIYGPAAILTQEQLNKNIGFDASGRDENSPIQIGKYASAAIDTNVIAGVTSPNTDIRNLGIAIGAYANAEGLTDTENQNIAIGPNAHAKGSSMIAIGPGINGSGETEGPNTYATGYYGVSIGYNAKGYGRQFLSIGSGRGKPTIASNDYAVAVGPEAQSLAQKAVAIGHNSTANAEAAVQIGEGVNSTPNSLQFQGVKVVQNGRMVGGEADPKELLITKEQLKTNEILVQLRAGSVSTILPEDRLIDGSTIYLNEPVQGDLRNYEMYIPNEPELCAGLPVGFGVALPEGIKLVIVDGKYQAHKLPVKITVRQPYGKLVIGKIEEFDDGTDWSPIITAAHIKWDGTKFTTDGDKLLEGTNLHSGVSLKIRYPIYGSTLITREVAGANDLNDQGILEDTSYSYIERFEYTPIETETPVATSGSIIPITLIYETKCGTSAAEFTVNYDTLP